MAEKPRSASTPPYVSWIVFHGFLDWLGETGIPVQIDRSFWSAKYSGGTGSQLMSGLRFLKLLDGELPTSSLEELVGADPDARKRLIKQLLRERYPSIFSIDLARATPKLLNEAFAGLGVDGHTHRKSQAFFINACKFADIPLAAGIRSKARNRQSGATRRRRNHPKTKPSGGTPQAPSQPPSQASTDQSRAIQLRGGGTLTLGLSVGMLNLQKGDLQFISDLMDRIRAYEADENEDATDET